MNWHGFIESAMKSELALWQLLVHCVVFFIGRWSKK